MTPIAPLNLVQNYFNNLLKTYPAVKNFCDQAQKGALTRDIIVNEMTQLHDCDSRTLRDIAKKFKKIVVAVDEFEDKFVVSDKVNALIIRMTKGEMPDTPFAQQLAPFLIDVKTKLDRDADMKLQTLGVELQLKAEAVNLQKLISIIQILENCQILKEGDLVDLNHSQQPDVALLSLLEKKLYGIFKETDRIFGLARALPQDSQKGKLAVANLLGIDDIFVSYHDKLSTLLALIRKNYEKQSEEIESKLFQEFKDNLQVLAALYTITTENVKLAIQNYINVEQLQGEFATNMEIISVISRFNMN